MNVTELARQLKVTTTELFDKLPKMGFDIGRRAIKVDDQIANKIIAAWKRASKDDRERSRIAEIRGEGQTEEVEPEEVVILDVMIPSVITVRELSQLTNVPVNKLLTTLMKNGVLTSMNERIDFDTASIIGEELGFKAITDTNDTAQNAVQDGQQILQDALAEDSLKSFQRPPIVVVMGHVDHGKTKILDAIRTTDIVSGESGGITQHIGAYQIHKNDRLITFIDTPGHEAFTAMRSRGARVADVAILVVAADDGVQPQTKEAIKIIQDAKLPFLVAINKIDKPEANIEKTKQDLASLNLLPADWGGQVTCVPVSAKEGTGIDDLLETILLLADMQPEVLAVDATRNAMGTIIESHIDKGEGPVATLLIQTGTLRIGDVVAVAGSYYGKIRALKDYLGNTVDHALPGMPVKLLGLKLAPEVGNIMEVSTDPKSLSRDIKKQRTQQERDVSMAQTATADGDSDRATINLMVKADVLGSVEAIIESLAKLDTGEVNLRIVSKGLGTITEADVLKAEATQAILIGFHVKPTAVAGSLARDKKVTIKYFEVIYHLIEDIESQLKLLVRTEAVRTLTGKLEVLKVFRRDAGSTILGGRVVDGYLTASDTVIVVRGEEALASGKVNRIESGKQVTEKVIAGQECGLSFVGKVVVEEGDILEFYQESSKK
jgi:translation initiation factor IF-2